MTPIPLTVRGLGLGLPERVVSNLDLAKTLETSDDWITGRTGIKERRILEDDQALSHLAIQAAAAALEDSQLSPSDIDLVLVTTLTPDTFMPATACRVAHAIGCSRAGAMDLNIACSGFLYGLITAASQISSGMAENVLVVGGDTLSRIVNWEDRRTAVLFGDSAGAAVVSAHGDGFMLGYDYGADGSGGAALRIDAGPSAPSDNPADYKVQMDGKSVFRFASNVLVDSSLKSLKMAGLKTEDLDLVIPHQANYRIIEAAAKRWGVSMDKFFLNLERYGNTSAGSIPVALVEARQAGRIAPGSRVMMTGFGGGLSWGSVLLQWPS